MLHIATPSGPLSFPIRWQGVTTLQYVNLMGLASATPYHMVRALCSDPERFDALADLQADVKIYARLPFLSTPFPEAKPPKSILLSGRVVDVPANIGLCTLGQKMILDDWLSDLETVTLCSAATRLLSVYLYPVWAKEPLTDVAQLPTLTRLIEQSPCTVAMPLAAFFLSKYESLTNFGEKSLPGPERIRFTLWHLPAFLNSLLFRITK